MISPDYNLVDLTQESFFFNEIYTKMYNYIHLNPLFTKKNSSGSKLYYVLWKCVRKKIIQKGPGSFPQGGMLPFTRTVLAFSPRIFNWPETEWVNKWFECYSERLVASLVKLVICILGEFPSFSFFSFFFKVQKCLGIPEQHNMSTTRAYESCDAWMNTTTTKCTGGNTNIYAANVN